MSNLDQHRLRFLEAVSSGDANRIMSIWKAHPDLLDGSGLTLDHYIEEAVDDDQVNSLRALASLGANIHRERGVELPDDVLIMAARAGATKCVAWLLENDVKVNYTTPHGPRCYALESAARRGHLEVAKLLVEHGALLNYVTEGHNPLNKTRFAMGAHVGEYLRSVGAKELADIQGELPAEEVQKDPLLLHLSKHFGDPDENEVHQVVVTEPAISIIVIRLDDEIVLATRGMSEKPVARTDGGEVFPELILRLPADWPVGQDFIGDDIHGWPIEWLFRIANYPHVQNKPFGSHVFFPNGSPPKPISSETEMTTFFAIAAKEDYGRLETPNKTITFYNVLPIYTEEHELEQEGGLGNLLKAFELFGVGLEVDQTRPNTAARS